LANVKTHSVIRDGFVMESGDLFDTAMAFSFGIERRRAYRILDDAIRAPHRRPALAIPVLDADHRVDRRVTCGMFSGLL
jgi:hypothetical protein